MSTSKGISPETPYEDMNKLLKIGSECFLLDPITTSDADLLTVLNMLSQAHRADPDGNYIPDENTRYGRTVIVTKDAKVDVEISITAKPVMTPEEFADFRAAGLEKYLAAHPENKPGIVHVSESYDPKEALSS